MNVSASRPSIHPRILCGVVLYGLICRIRASRKLEEALLVRVDCRWLVHGMSIDHSTICEFRRRRAEQLRDLFVQIVLVGQAMGLVPFRSIGFDGTRGRANNRKTGTRTPDELRESKQKLPEEFDRLNEKADDEDAQDDEVFGGTGGAGETPAALSEEKQRRRRGQLKQRVDAALEELEKSNRATKRRPNACRVGANRSGVREFRRRREQPTSCFSHPLRLNPHPRPSCLTMRTEGGGGRGKYTQIKNTNL